MICQITILPNMKAVQQKVKYVFLYQGEATPVTVPDPAGCRMEEELENVLLRDKQKETELENVYITLFKLQSLFTSNSRFLHYIMVVLLQECRDIYNKICEHKKLLENVFLIQSMNCIKRVFLLLFDIVFKRSENLGTMKLSFMIC